MWTISRNSEMLFFFSLGCAGHPRNAAIPASSLPIHRPTRGISSLLLKWLLIIIIMCAEMTESGWQENLPFLFFRLDSSQSLSETIHLCSDSPCHLRDTNTFRRAAVSVLTWDWASCCGSVGTGTLQMHGQFCSTYIYPVTIKFVQISVNQRRRLLSILILTVGFKAMFVKLDRS